MEFRSRTDYHLTTLTENINIHSPTTATPFTSLTILEDTLTPSTEGVTANGIWTTLRFPRTGMARSILPHRRDPTLAQLAPGILVSLSQHWSVCSDRNY